MRVLLYGKVLKETKREETIVYFVTFLSLVAYQLGGGRAPSPGYAYEHLLRISTSFIAESKKRNSFLRQIISCSLIGLLIIAVRNFLRFFDCSFVSAFEPIFILKLD